MRVIPRQAFYALRPSEWWLRPPKSLLISKSATWPPIPDSLSWTLLRNWSLLTIVECLCTSFTRFTAEPSLTCCSRRTNNKIVIGTVFVLDDKVREPISVQHLHCKWFRILYIHRSRFHFSCACFFYQIVITWLCISRNNEAPSHSMFRNSEVSSPYKSTHVKRNSRQLRIPAMFPRRKKEILCSDQETDDYRLQYAGYSIWKYGFTSSTKCIRE
jgi:hypothetical protein